MPTERKIFEPSDLFSRILYALFAAIGPRVTIYLFNAPSEDLREACFAFGVWSAISILYTIHWAIMSYRKLKGNLCVRR